MMKNLDFDQVQSRVVLTIQSGSVNPQLTGKDVVDGVRFSFVLRDLGDTLEKKLELVSMRIYELTVHHY